MGSWRNEQIMKKLYEKNEGKLIHHLKELEYIGI